jgi:RNA polymerase sigma-70 factor, ECF subfamily
MHDEHLATLRAWQHGDEAATLAVFEIYYPRAVRLAALSGLTMEQAQDCSQEAFVRAYERREQLRDVAAFPLWFHRIVTRQILTMLQAPQYAREIPLETAETLTEDWFRRDIPQPDALVLAAEQREEMWRALQQLPHLFRVAIVLRYYSGFSVREVADLLGKREATIRVTLHRAIARLRGMADFASLFEQPSPLG